jgi:hypothetical protein
MSDLDQKYQVVTAPADLPDARFRRLFELWQEAGPRPPASFVDPIRLRFLLGSLVIFDIEPAAGEQPTRYRYRLCGVDICDRIGIDLTGQHVEDHPDPQARITITRSLTNVTTEERAYLAIGRRRILERAWRVQTLLLPLFDQAGRVAVVLCAQVFEEGAPRWRRPKLRG